jgi:integrase
MLLETVSAIKKPRDSSQARGISRPRLETLQDLMDAIRRGDPGDSKLVAMLGATADHISRALGKPLNDILICQLPTLRPALRIHLRERRFKRNSIRSYANFLRILLAKARELGWSECSPDVERAWEEIRRVTRKKLACSTIIRYAIRNGLTPAQFTEAHLTNWREAAIRDGRSAGYLTDIKGRLKKAVYDAGLSWMLPRLAFQVYEERSYGFGPTRLSEPLRTQILDLLKWKTAEFSPGRTRRTKNRPISAKHLRLLLCQLAAFAARTQKEAPTSLSALLSREIVTGYAEWALNQKRVKGRTVHTALGRICGLKCYPPLASPDFSWIWELMAQLPLEEYAQIKERKERRRVPYDDLARIPDQIRREAALRADLTPRRRAAMGRDALLIRWFTVLPWRQRNVRECIIRPFSEGGSLWKEEVPPHIAKSTVVEQALKANPHERFWQFYFRPLETKTGCTVRALLPQQLVKPLEDYIEHHRGILLGARPDPGTLFLGDWGSPLLQNDVSRLVGDITQRYTGHRVNPHLCRDIFATEWLEDHPESYLRLSKILWHSDPKTTIQIYGAGFDESHGARSAEEWLDARDKGKKKSA